MSIPTKQAVSINFAQGMNQKTDPWQLPIGQFLNLQNSIFTKGGLLQKRNGYQNLTNVPDSTTTYLTTLNGGLTGIGNTISAFSSSADDWISKGQLQPMEIGVLSLVKNNLNQTACDSVIAPNGLICTVYTEYNGSGTDNKYVIADSSTGQNIISPTLIPVGTGTVSGGMRVFLLGNYFILTFTNTISGTAHLQYIAISTYNPTIITANVNLAAAYTPKTTLSWDAAVFPGNDRLYVAYNTVAGGQAIKVTYLTATAAAAGGAVTTPVTFATQIATMISVSIDTYLPTNPIIYVSYYDLAGTTGYTLAVNSALSTVLAPTEIIASGTILNLTSSAYNGIVTIFEEVSNVYSYDSGIASNYVEAVTCTVARVVGTPYTVIRSVGLASKSFMVNGITYFLAAYSSPYQPTYFLINASLCTEAAPIISAKLAYENGGGYLTTGLPSVTVNGNVAQVPYLYKDLIAALNTVNNSIQSTTGGIYSQTGINLGSFTIGTQNIDTAEIANNLHISGGFLWQYDGYLPVEHNFFLWPDSVEAVASATSGSMTAQQYYYQAIYSWADNQGNIYRSAPSIPVTITLTDKDAVDISIPTLRLTYKTANPVKIELYRWSAANQIYYQVTSITSPTLNDTTADSVTYTDLLADSSIIGNNIIYTNGGVLEDVNAPASNVLTLFDDRLWLVDNEDNNLLWFSKQVIESTPVEMSDLLTFYVAPTLGSEGSTGPITALAPMDDKLIIFKNNAIYYINGSGPDNTGSNNQYSQPFFITSTVGCSNQASIVLIKDGLMFQSNKGIWLLDRNLGTSYIGAPVENFNSSVVQSSVNIPGAFQARFTLNTGQTLMYDYFYGQWGTFVGVPAISSCIFEELHTFLNSHDQVYQENPNSYLDGTIPVLLSFTTSWLNLAGLQGYLRAYEFFLLGKYLTPHKLNVQIAYDYNPSILQSSIISPDNFSSSVPSPFGSPSAPFGSPGNLENWRVFLKKERCQSFQLTISEIYDPSFGAAAGEGLTLSGINLIVGKKSGFRTIPSGKSVG